MSLRAPIGIAGAGTMGRGIARACAEAGVDAVVHDPDPAQLAALPAHDRIALAPDLPGLGGCGLVIECAPEDLALKRELLAELAVLLGDDAVLATNTSSLTVGAVAAAIERPSRVIGLHFFNPAHRMRLVELVAGPASSAAALAAGRALGEALGKTVIAAADGPGFLVNRCNRPFTLEALRIVAERVATPAQVDRIVRLGGGFPMGPFALLDLIGLPTALAVQRSFHEQSFGEPRWRPSPLLAQAVAAGRTRLHDEPPPPDEPAPEPGGGLGRLVVVAGESPLAQELRTAAAAAGWRAATPLEAEGEIPALILDCGATEADPPLQGGPQALLVGGAPLGALDPGGPSAGFSVLPPLAAAPLVELTRGPHTPAPWTAQLERFFVTLGKHVEWVADAPGLVLARLLACLVNEACFAVGEGAGAPADVDAGMVLGLNHPRGPLEWADGLGPGEVAQTMIALHEEYAEERYRVAPYLLRAARAELALRPDR